ncbi:GPI transamidase component GPI17 [Verticillium dahliae VDG2]|nr:GPI transamidase component GPI17 [Verticillium dahliae VDG2]
MAQSFPSGGMIEYIVSQEYARKVLTEESSFSFERGMEEILGIHWMRYIHGGTFFRDVDSVVRELSTKKLRSIAKETWPVFELGVSELLNTVQDEKPVDILPHVKRIMAQATIRILLGPTYQNEEDVNRILDISADVAELMGLRRHESRMAHKYPRLWRTLTL